MKRVIIALILLFVTIGLNILSEKMVNSYCDNIKNDLGQAVSSIDDNDYEKATKIVKKAKGDKSLVPYIYNLDFKKIKKELDDAENLLKLREYDYAKICILRSISLADDINEEYAYFHG